MEHILEHTPPFYQRYIRLAAGKDVIESLELQQEELSHFFITFPMDRFDYRYAPQKWSVKEVVQHCIDTERIMSYRALAIARKEKRPLIGYDEDAYTEHSFADLREPDELVNEWLTLRNSTLQLFNSFPEKVYAYEGSCDNKSMTVEMLGAIISGHSKHHLNIIKERYL